ncbi:c-type cytochrome [Bradyrhizobium sp.]|uniref:c-type cytochrome n=1 Tax=Bradyrhizobium sp. TaxID=376 RepID=UPI003C6910D1
MESFELNKVLGAVLGLCLCLQVIHLSAGAIFAPKVPAKPGFEIAVKQAETAAQPATKAPEEPIENLLAAANVDHGKELSRVCMACHTLQKGEPNKIGPNLYGVVGRPRASEPGYDYSAAMKAKGGTWTFDELNKFLAGPRNYIPGTKMTFAGFDNEHQRADVIAYLRTLSDNPVPLPTATAAPASSKPGEPSSPQKKGS